MRFGYPSADKVSLASLEEVATLDTPRRRRGAPRRVVPGRARPAGGPRRLVGQRQVDHRLAGAPPLRRRRRRGAARRRRRPRPVVRRHPRHARAWSPRTATCSTTRSARTCASPGPRRPTTSCGTRCARPAWPTLVESLPDGLDTVVGERGYRFSGGERQRLTIARILLARPRVVILDEATAHLDSTSEAAVQAALADALAGRTAIVIAHRLSTIRDADAILVVEDGRIVERGTHAELLAAGGRYAELYRTQFEDESGGGQRSQPDRSSVGSEDDHVRPPEPGAGAAAGRRAGRVGLRPRSRRPAGCPAPRGHRLRPATQGPRAPRPELRLDRRSHHRPEHVGRRGEPDDHAPAGRRHAAGGCPPVRRRAVQLADPPQRRRGRVGDLRPTLRVRARPRGARRGARRDAGAAAPGRGRAGGRVARRAPVGRPRLAARAADLDVDRLRVGLLAPQ